MHHAFSLSDSFLLQDNSGEKLYQVQTNPVLVLVSAALVVVKTLFVSPCQWSVSFCKFYSRKYDGPTEALKRLSATPIKYNDKSMLTTEQPLSFLFYQG